MGQAIRDRIKVHLAQVGVIVLLVLAWQYLPQIPWLQQQSHVFDPFFVSSPRKVFTELVRLASGSHETVSIWSYLWTTVYSALLGMTIGMVFGGLCGLILSNFGFLSAVLRPFVAGANAVPRIVLIPVIVIIFGPSTTSSVVVSFLTVFFLSFFNAYDGGTSIPERFLQNARLLGGGSWALLTRVRLPYVIAWTLGSLPLAVTFAVVAVVTGEILTGNEGVGELLVTASTTADASLTFAVAVYLAVISLVIIGGAEVFRRRVLHWWAK